MARKPRIHYPGAVYHVILRGDGGQDIFFAKGDRVRFCFLLREGVEKFGHRLHAFCLMTNHVHPAIQVGGVPLSRIMQNIGFRYTEFGGSSGDTIINSSCPLRSSHSTRTAREFGGHNP